MSKIGTEFLVNTTTAGEQLVPTITGLTNGTFVVTWTDTSGGNINQYDIKAQMYDAAGAPVGTEFVVNTKTELEQGSSTVTALADGGFVVTWNDRIASGFAGIKVKAQVFDAAGAKVGTEFGVNPVQAAYYQYSPTVSGLTNGGFVVSYMEIAWNNNSVDYPINYNVYAQLFDATGSEVGTRTLVHTDAREDIFQGMSATITGLADGGFVVAWKYKSGDSGISYGIAAQIFDAAGVKVGSEFLVDTEGGSIQLVPSITGLANGSFVVTWFDMTVLGNGNYSVDIKAQVFDAAGAKVGTELLVNTVTEVGQYWPAVTGLTNGSFVITWAGIGNGVYDSNRSRLEIQAQVFDATGVKTGPEFQVNTAVLRDQTYPSVAALSDGNFVITWQDESSGLGDIKAQIFSPIDGPVAANGAGNGNEDAAINGTLAASDANGDALTYARVANAQHGNVVVNADGSYIYTPNANYNGPDSFTFKANDGALDSNVATVTLTVTAVNDTPVAANAAKAGNEDTSIAGTLVASDVDGTPLTYSVVAQAAHGTVAVNTNGTYAYTPVANYSGPDSFTFKASDGTLDSNVATVTLTVTAVNDAPVAANGAGSGAENTPITGTITASDIEGAALTYSRVAQAAHGSVTVNPDGTYSYTPNAGYYGPDSFTFKANDGGLDSNVATVNLTVTEKSDPPTDIDLSVTNVDEFAPNDTVVGSLTTLDPDGADTFTYSLLDDAGGRFAIDGSNLVVANYILLDYEQHASHTILVRSTDASGLVVDKALTIAVNDINPELVTGTTDDDHVVGGAVADIINGGDGHDHLVGGGGGDQLNGNDGNDFIEAGEGNDTVFGGIGDDRIDSGGGDDNVSGEAGNDTVTVSGGSDSVGMGTGDDDLLIVDYSAFSAGIITGGGFTGSGLDWGGLYQVAQVAVQFTGVARFDIRGSSGADTIRTGSNNDRASLGDGNDTVDTGTGEVQLDGGIGTDGWVADFTALTTALAVNLQTNTITGAGASTITGIETLGHSNIVYFKSGAGNDQLTTLAGPTNTFSDYIQTNAGDDVVTVGGGSDIIEMGAGDHDLLIVDYSGYSGGVQTGGGFGGSGLDWSGAYQVNFAGPDYVQFTGVAHFDIRGGAGADAIITGDNSDSVSLGQGNDTANTRAGAVQLDGGAGMDGWAADFTAMTTGLSVDLQTNTITGLAASTIFGIETLGFSLSAYFKTGSGNDALNTLVGPTSTFSDYIQTNGGDDTVVVGGGSDEVEMGAGGDDLLIVDYSGYSGGVQTGGNFGGSGVDWSGLYQVNFSGPDYVRFTGVARFEVRGGAGADNIITGGGNDVIDGNAGNDTLTGGAGDDLFRFAVGDGADTLAGFVAGTGTDDKIELTGFAGINTLGDILAISTQSGADTVINFGGGNTITLQNVLKTNLAADDFTLIPTPVITSNGGGATAGVSIAENTTAVTTITATGTSLIYAIIGGADANKFKINSSSGVLSFVNAPDFEVPADADHNNTYLVQVRASGGSLFDDQTITVAVTDVTDNAAPVITSNGGGATASISVSENSTAVTTVAATDLDAGATLTYSIVGGADQGKFQIDSSTGALSFIAAPDFETPADADHNNSYLVQVRASDGTLFDDQTITVGVTDVNEVVNQPPTITSNGGGPTASVSVGENTAAITTVVASDPDAGTTLIYSIVGGADQGKFQINASSGALSFIAAPDFEAPADADHNNSYLVQVRASDGSLFDDQTITVAIVDTAETNPAAKENDFNGDGRSDILWRHSGGTVATWELNGDTFNPHGFGVDNSWHIVGTGDFNADNRSDLLWRHDGGTVATWEMNGGVFAPHGFTADTAWHVVDTGDFNGDGRSDILWRHDDGTVATWEMNGGTFSPHGFVAGNAWHIAATDDFNGDGRSDILWRHDDGTVAIWEMNGGSFSAHGWAADTAWHIAGTGDFNGDGHADILWRHDDGTVATWEMNGGTFGAHAFGMPNAWHIEGTGDFNADGRSDILWRHDNGAVETWEMNGATFTAHDFSMETPWHISDTGDFNGDGRSDILWRHDNGATQTWEMNGGTFAAHGFTVDTSWKIVGHHFDLI